VLAQTAFPSTEMRRRLAAALSMSPRTVQIWFQNQRQKEKNKKASRELWSNSNVFFHNMTVAQDSRPSASGPFSLDKIISSIEASSVAHYNVASNNTTQMTLLPQKNQEARPLMMTFAVRSVPKQSLMGHTLIAPKEPHMHPHILPPPTPPYSSSRADLQYRLPPHNLGQRQPTSSLRLDIKSVQPHIQSDTFTCNTPPSESESSSSSSIDHHTLDLLATAALKVASFDKNHKQGKERVLGHITPTESSSPSLSATARPNKSFRPW
jgi:hypothetical protein